MIAPLTPRARLLADLCPQGAVLAEIGCDSAEISLTALNEGRAQAVIAADISEKALSRARGRAAAMQLTHKTAFVCADGLSQLPRWPGCLIIAGMGAQTICHILAGAEKDALYILQPNRDAYLLRKSLYKTGFSIQAEYIAREKNRFYEILAVRKQAGAPPADCYLPHLALAKKDALARAYLAHWERVLTRALSGTENAAGAAHNESLLLAKKRLSAVKEAQHAYFGIH